MDRDINVHEEGTSEGGCAVALLTSTQSTARDLQRKRTSFRTDVYAYV